MNLATLLTTMGADGGAGPSLPTRKGAVRPVDKAVRDDTGFFHPLGLTFFWAMQGYRSERDRFLKNLDWLVAHGRPDYLRILGQVDWSGREIDPRWPDYDATFLGVLDAVNSRGMKVELTMLGSPYDDPVGLAHRLSGLIMQRPAGSVIDVEIWNEWSQNGGSQGAMNDAARVFLAESGVPLVALSSDCDDNGPATLRTAHTDRGGGDGNWRMVRQGFDAKEGHLVYSGNEPPGPNSSVNVLESPLQLAMLRATSIQSGGALWVLHVGDMVMGIEDPGHNRHPNLWECEIRDEITGQLFTLEETIKAVRVVDAWLPENVENWQPKSAGNPNINPQTLIPDIAGWPDGGEGVNRFYSAFDGPRFCQVLNGIKGTRTFTQVCPDGGTYNVIGINPQTGEQIHATLAAGQTWTIPGRGDGMTGYILNGIKAP